MSSSRHPQQDPQVFLLNFSPHFSCFVESFKDKPSGLEYHVVNLQTKPSFSPLFAWLQLDFSATSDSVSVVSLRRLYQLSYCWILKLLSGQT
jgi:hypothetical protein